MHKRLILIFVLFVPLLIMSQNGNDLIRPDAINVYVDCSRCDNDFIREQINFVNYVWDRKNADVHILFSSLRNGGGGREYTLTFIGQKDFLNVNDTLKFNISESDSDDDERSKMIKVIKLGLIKYISKTPIADNIQISYKEPVAVGNESVNTDEWDYWVFKTRLRGYMNGEKSRGYLSLFGSISANRITEDWKVKISFHGSYNESSFTYNSENILSISRYQGVFASIIKSQTDHLSLGMFSNINSSIYNNMNVSISLAPGIEYNIFPYSESTRRQLRVTYKAYFGYNNYNEETIYLKNKEMLWSEKLAVTLELVQPWGTIESEVSGAHYFHDFSLNSIRLVNELRINVIKGLTIDINGTLAYIHDQIALPVGGVSLEEILLQRTQLETDYEYWLSFGFTYSFGSIYNNVVNTRFGN